MIVAADYFVGLARGSKRTLCTARSASRGRLSSITRRGHQDGWSAAVQRLRLGGPSLATVPGDATVSVPPLAASTSTRVSDAIERAWENPCHAVVVHCGTARTAGDHLSIRFDGAQRRGLAIHDLSGAAETTAAVCGISS